MDSQLTELIVARISLQKLNLLTRWLREISVMSRIVNLCPSWTEHEGQAKFPYAIWVPRAVCARNVHLD